ncbi:MAG: WYL domain-containing protein [Deltaproteobacteria bacterium]|nr:WYL domain-containing protein [Deltaproteobacteria bacterium]
MERTQRILSLVTMLLDARRPVPFTEIRESFPSEYEGTVEAAERKFERDKVELLELGVPLHFVKTEDGEGYELDRSAYYLPDLGLTREETAVLLTAGAAALDSGAFPLASDLRHALRKVDYLAPGAQPGAAVRFHPDAGAAGGAAREALPALWAALAARKTVTFEYQSPHRPGVETRKVDPWGLAFRRGTWTLVGRCHLRGALRTFLVGRIRAVQANAQRPRTPDYVIPSDFRLDDHVAHHPWGHRFHEPLEVTVELRGPLAPLWERTLPGARQLEAGEGRVRVALGVTYLDGLCRHLLSLAPHARVAGPADAAARYRDLALAAAARHGEGRA